MGNFSIQYKPDMRSSVIVLLCALKDGSIFFYLFFPSHNFFFLDTCSPLIMSFLHNLCEQIVPVAQVELGDRIVAAFTNPSGSVAK